MRVIRKMPWIAVGAAGAYYLDGTRGGTRRAQLRHRLSEMRKQAMKGDPMGMFDSEETPIAPSVPATNARSRAAQPLPEEESAGVVETHFTMAAHILQESEERTVDRDGTASEFRSSEDTVEDPSGEIPLNGFGVTSGVRAP